MGGCGKGGGVQAPESFSWSDCKYAHLHGRSHVECDVLVSTPPLWELQGMELSLAQNLAAGASGRSLRQGTSFRSRAQSGQSGDGSESQAGMEGVGECRVESWNGAYLEAKSQSAVLREQQDWLAHNKEVLQDLQVCCVFGMYTAPLHSYCEMNDSTSDCMQEWTCKQTSGWVTGSNRWMGGWVGGWVDG